VPRILVSKISMMQDISLQLMERNLSGGG